MKILLVGLNHRTAPVEVRERFAVAPETCGGLSGKLANSGLLREAAILSTCNRTELLGVAEEEASAMGRLISFLADIGRGTPEPRHLYRLREDDAVLHVFRVASSVDSMVLGEAQILGQVKLAYRCAVEAGSCGPVLNRLFQHAFRAAKRVRTDTGLGASSVSVAAVGVQLARELFESFESKKVLLIGAGEVAETALEGLCRAGVSGVVVANRTVESAESLAARFAGHAVGLEAVPDELGTADVVLSSVQVSGPLLTRADLERSLGQRHGRPLLAIDLGLPRNIEPAATEIEGLYLYDIDDLQEIAERGRERRREAAEVAEAILRDEARRFDAWRSALPLGPAIAELADELRRLAREEALQAAGRLSRGGRASDELLERLGESVVNRILHVPLVRLREAADSGTGLYYAEAIRRLFGLDEEEQ